MNVGKILVPTDFSECAKAALETAFGFARVFDAELIIAHVVEAPIYPAVTFAGAANVPTVHEEIAQICDDKLATLATGVPEGIRVQTRRLDGTPFREITQLAKKEHVDLIVISTHGYTGFAHLMMGSTAERVVRTAPCPVLTVRGGPSDE